MSFLTNFFVIGSYVIVALALSMGLQAFAGVQPVVGWLAAAVFFLFAAQIHGALNRAQENGILVHDIATIRQALAAFERDLEDLRAQAEDLDGRVLGVTDRRNRRLTAEMNVLESLVKQLASGVAEQTAREQEAGVTRWSPKDDETPDPAWNLDAFDSANPSAFDRASDEQLLRAVRASLEENRVELYLQPIVSLPQRRLRYYEALTRLRAEGGEVLMPRHYLYVAEGAGLISIIDNLLLFRSVQVVRKLMERDSDVRVFCNISTRSLQDNAFFPQFLDFMENHADLAAKLIFEFTQDTIDMCGPLELANLRRLTGLGFRFSMDQVTDLEFDTAALRDRGFSFVKIPVATLAQCAEAGLDISEVKTRLTRHGLDLIAEKIEDDDAVQNVIAAGVDFGQGYLLGEPRPAANEKLAPSSRAEVPAGAVA